MLRYSILAAFLFANPAQAQIGVPVPIIVTVSTAYALIIEKPGCDQLTLNASGDAPPAFTKGQIVEVTGDGKNCSGTVTRVLQTISQTRTPTVEVRQFTTRVILR